MPPRYFIGIERQPDFMTTLFTPASAQRTFFIAAAGNDSNAGTSSGAPWKTIAKVNAQFMEPGDTYSFNGGDTFNDATLTPNTSGTVASPITFTSYGTGHATISRTASSGFSLTNKSYITVSNLTFTGSGGTTSVGVHCFYSLGSNSNIILSGLTVSGFASSGILIDCSGGGLLSNVAITGCTASGNCLVDNTQSVLGTGGIMGVGIYGADVSGNYQLSNLQISNCIAHDNTGASGSTNWCGSGIAIFQCNGGFISGCVAYSNGAGNTNGAGPVGIWTADSSNITIQYCESYNNRTVSGGSDGGGFDLDGGSKNNIIQYCYSHGNYGTGIQSFTYQDPTNITGNHNNIIRFCVSENDAQNPGTTGQSGMALAADRQSVNVGLQVYNNVVVGGNAGGTNFCLGLGNAFSSGGTFIANVCNNIFYTSNANQNLLNDGGSPTDQVFFTGNNYFAVGTFTIVWRRSNVYHSFATWQAGTSTPVQEEIGGVNVGFNVDPKLTNPGSGGTLNTGSYMTPALLATLNAYQLSTGSTMFSAGLDVGQFSITIPGLDLYSNILNQVTLSIGAQCPISAP